MIQVTPQIRILVAVEPVDFRAGIDGLCKICRTVLASEPFAGTVFVFCNRSRTAIKLLSYDGQGFWLCQKRLSSGRFRHWPSDTNGIVHELLAHELGVLVMAGDPTATQAPPAWRRVGPPDHSDGGSIRAAA